MAENLVKEHEIETLKRKKEAELNDSYVIDDDDLSLDDQHQLPKLTDHMVITHINVTKLIIH